MVFLRHFLEFPSGLPQKDSLQISPRVSRKAFMGFLENSSIVFFLIRKRNLSVNYPRIPVEMLSGNRTLTEV